MLSQDPCCYPQPLIGKEVVETKLELLKEHPGVIEVTYSGVSERLTGGLIGCLVSWLSHNSKIEEPMSEESHKAPK